MVFELRLKLIAGASGRLIPINYQYELMPVIYKIFDKADRALSEELHDNGFVAQAKHHKLFTYSNLMILSYNIIRESERLEILSDYVSWYVGFADKRCTKAFLQGVLCGAEFDVGDKLSRVRFRVSEIRIQPELSESDKPEFETISPIVVSQLLPGERHRRYLSPYDEKYEQGLLAGLLSRYEALNGKPFEGEKYCKIEFRNEPKSALIKIKAGTRQETKVRGYRYRFVMDAPRELLELAYNCGLGEKGSMGFGMIRERR